MIRPATIDDRAVIRDVECAAFPTSLEADLVESLVDAGDATLSLVAERDNMVVGHLLCSRMSVEADGRPVRAVAIGPVAVRPDCQRAGVGSALIREALQQSRAAGEEMVFLVGHREFYPRFGFSVETARPFASPYAGDHFMAIRFDGAPPPGSGRADYAPAFASLGGEG